jgi:tyrosine-protein phosphatase YwqE
MHSHLLPGIDDGSPDLETSLLLVKGLQSLGFSKLITTPHIMGGMYENYPQIIEEKCTELNAFLKADGVDVPLVAAAEYFLDDQMESRMQSKQKLLTWGENRILCEFSMLNPVAGIKEMLFELVMQGLQPVIAHPERYMYLERNKEFYEELKDMGCLFQLNLLALGPHYGKTVTSLALYLSKKGYYDYVGTDLHHARHLELLRDPKMVEGVKRVMGECRIRNKEIIV